MIRESLYHDEHFWKTMEFIDKLNHPIPISDLFGHFDLTSQELEQLTIFLESFGYSLKRCNQTGRKLLYPPPSNSESLDLSQLSDEVPSYELSKVTPIKDSDSQETNCEKCKLIDLAISKGAAIRINEEISLFPHRLVYIENELTLIAEKFHSNQLNAINMVDINSVVSIGNNGVKFKYADKEVDDFILQMIHISGQVERLILKINNSGKPLSLSPKYLYIGRPYMTTNGEGLKIWAAHVELAPPLFEWLLSIQKHIEIVDPVSVKWALLQYCEKKLKKVS